MDPYRSPASDPQYPLFEPERPRLWKQLRWLVLAIVLLAIGGPLAMLDVWLETGSFELPAGDDEVGVVGAVAMLLVVGAACIGFYGVVASLGHIGERADYRRLRRLAWNGELIHAEVTALQALRDNDGFVQFFLILDLGGGVTAEQRGFYEYHRWLLEPLGEFVRPELPEQDYSRVSVALDPSKRFTMQVVVDPNNRGEHHILTDRGIEASPRSEPPS